MDKWFCDAELIPTAALDTDSFAGASAFEPSSADPVDAWASMILPEGFESELDILLERADAWSPDIDVWGSEFGSRVFLYRSGNLIQSLLVRFDLKLVDTIFLGRICDLASDLGCRFLLLDSGRTVEPTLQALVAALHPSAQLVHGSAIAAPPAAALESSPA
jgi:hypothetical protein